MEIGVERMTSVSSTESSQNGSESEPLTDDSKVKVHFSMPWYWKATCILFAAVTLVVVLYCVISISILYINVKPDANKLRTDYGTMESDVEILPQSSARLSMLPSIQHEAEYSQGHVESSTLKYNDRFTVFSMLDFQKLGPTTSVVEIRGDLGNKVESLAGNFDGVKELVINGKITEKWLLELLSKMKYLFKLVLDLDKLCLGAREINKKRLPLAVLNGIQTLSIRNDTLCELSTWIYSWNFPNLNVFTIERTDFRQSSFTAVGNFVEKARKQLQFAEFSDCRLCSNCNKNRFEQYDFLKLNCSRTDFLS